MPPKVTAEMAKGFKLYMLKAFSKGVAEHGGSRASPIQSEEMRCSGEVLNKVILISRSVKPLAKLERYISALVAKEFNGLPENEIENSCQVIRIAFGAA